MNKKAMLFTGLVVLCIMAVMVTHFIVNGSGSTDPVEQEGVLETSQAGQAPDFPEQIGEEQKEDEPVPVYEATVGNGTILF